MSNVNAVNPEHRVTIAARVPPDLAEAVAELADAGDRTVSREVFRAIKSHVERSAMGGDSLEARDGSSLGRSSFADASAERDGTSEREAVEPAQLAEDDER